MVGDLSIPIRRLLVAVVRVGFDMTKPSELLAKSGDFLRRIAASGMDELPQALDLAARVRQVGARTLQLRPELLFTGTGRLTRFRKLSFGPFKLPVRRRSVSL
jgi:hypothetical protein